MRRSVIRIITAFTLALALFIMLPVTVQAKSEGEPFTLSGKNPDSGYETLIIDEAGLFTEAEARDVYEVMGELAYYGNVVLYTLSENDMSY